MASTTPILFHHSEDSGEKNTTHATKPEPYPVAASESSDVTSAFARVGLRERANTSPTTTKTANLASRRRTVASAASEQSLPLRINLARVTEQYPKIAETLRIRNPSDPPSPRTAPIDIPQRKDTLQRPTTPLTGRPTGTVFALHKSINPPTSSSPSSSDSDLSALGTRLPHKDTASLKQKRSLMPVRMGPRQGQPHPYRPSSPLSPSMPIAIPANPNQQRARRPAHGLHLAGLPKFHPANFPATDSNTPLSPGGAHAVNSQARHRPESDAQRELRRHQRDNIDSATLSSRSALSSRIDAKPTSPHLAPLGSPAEPMTPLMLEGRGDYLMAGFGLSPSKFKDGSGRGMVERLVQKENKRRHQPGARSGSVSPSVGPAISPAGGRG